MSTLIFAKKIMEGVGLYAYPMQNILRIKKKSNIKVDIWHPAVGLRCRNPHRHLSQLKAREIPLIETPSGQELCRP
jgi:hypothetical protein